MLPRFLLDTHVLLLWLTDPKKLSREQIGTLERSTHKGEPIAFSAISLLETALLASSERFSVRARLGEFLSGIESNPIFRVLPITHEIALEVASLPTLKDPADRAIVATARVHRLTLMTSDERIIKSQLVKVVE